jgi:hypothetical protein
MAIFREFSVTWGIGLPDSTLTPVAGVAAVTEPPDRLRVMDPWIWRPGPIEQHTNTRVSKWT